MSLTTFRDGAGVRWRVWHVETPRTRAHLMDANFQNGWLVFEQEDGSNRRRLSQVPEDWASLSPEHLARLCALAVAAPPARPSSSLTTIKMPISPRPSDFSRER